MISNIIHSIVVGVGVILISVLLGGIIYFVFGLIDDYFKRDSE